MNSSPNDSYVPLPADPRFLEYVDEGSGSVVRLPKPAPGSAGGDQ